MEDDRMISRKEYRDHWSEDGQVFFCDGKGYGLTDNLETICLGSEEYIERYLNTGQFGSGFSPLQRHVLRNILAYRKEQNVETASTGAAGMERAIHYGASRGKPQAARLSKTRKRLPLRPSRTKNKGIPRR
jgi:hypothetical protein